MATDRIIYASTNTKIRRFDTEYATAAKVVCTIPSGYRLFKTKFGELKLQGAYKWQQGSEDGLDWVDIPTIYESEL